MVEDGIIRNLKCQSLMTKFQFIVFIKIVSNCEPWWFGEKMYENPNCDLIVRHAQICHNHQTCEGHKNTMKKMGVL
jgi:hypothetical protein